jgi:hypothetical protein
MSQATPPPDREPPTGVGQPKREYHAPELRDIGSLTELTQSGAPTATVDSSYLS